MVERRDTGHPSRLLFGPERPGSFEMGAPLVAVDVRVADVVRVRLERLALPGPPVVSEPLVLIAPRLVGVAPRLGARVAPQEPVELRPGGQDDEADGTTEQPFFDEVGGQPRTQVSVLLSLTV